MSISISSPGVKVALTVVATVLPVLLGYSVGGSREHSKGLVAARVSEARCDSTTQAKNAEIARLGSRSDSLLRIIEVRREMRRVDVSRPSHYECGCGHADRGSGFWSRARDFVLGGAVAVVLDRALGHHSGGMTATAIATASSGSNSGGGGGHGHKPHKRCK